MSPPPPSPLLWVNIEILKKVVMGNKASGAKSHNAVVSAQIQDSVARELEALHAPEKGTGLMVVGYGPTPSVARVAEAQLLRGEKPFTKNDLIGILMVLENNSNAEHYMIFTVGQLTSKIRLCVFRKGVGVLKGLLENIEQEDPPPL